MEFEKQLAQYRALIDQEIDRYCDILLLETEMEYGMYSRELCGEFVALLRRGGKRIRGALTMVAYELVGGADKVVIAQAARAVEMIHAYLLIFDDIVDRSSMRRGGPTVHVRMEAYHRARKLRGDATHFGHSTALHIALLGLHLAELTLLELAVSAETKAAALETIHTNLVRTVHGQLRDILNEYALDVTEEDALRVVRLKTSYYSFLNPLSLGIVLGGRSAVDTDAGVLEEYGLHAGIAFQLSDDLIGVFGNAAASGKSPKDDVREGKMTVLMLRALQRSTHAEKEILRSALGNQRLTDEEFSVSRRIIKRVGAADDVRYLIGVHTERARSVLERAPQHWPVAHVSFLRDLVGFFAERKA